MRPYPTFRGVPLRDREIRLNGRLYRPATPRTKGRGSQNKTSRDNHSDKTCERHLFSTRPRPPLVDLETVEVRQTVSPCGLVVPKGLPNQSRGASALNSPRCDGHSPVRWSGITAQYQGAKDPVGALNSKPEPMKTNRKRDCKRDGRGFVSGEGWRRHLALFRKHMPEETVSFQVFLQDVEPNEARGSPSPL